MKRAGCLRELMTRLQRSPKIPKIKDVAELQDTSGKRDRRPKPRMDKAGQSRKGRWIYDEFDQGVVSRSGMVGKGLN